VDEVAQEGKVRAKKKKKPAEKGPEFFNLPKSPERKSEEGKASKMRKGKKERIY